MMTYAETPASDAEQAECSDEMPADWQDKIMHACLELGDSLLMGSDAPGNRYEKPQGLHVSINVEEVAEAERIFAALSEGGSVFMPIGETFWAKRFGMVTDRFGIPWMVNCGKEM